MITMKKIDYLLKIPKLKITIMKIIAYVLMVTILKTAITHNKSHHGKLTFILGDSMVKDVDGYLLTGSINRKSIVKVRPVSSAKTINIENYTKLSKRDFNPNLYILRVGTNDFFLDDTPDVISNCIITKIIMSNIDPRGDKYRNKV